MKKIIRPVIGVLAVGLLLFAVVSCGSPAVLPESAITLKAGEVVTFTNNEAGGPENGWSDSEPSGTWSTSESPKLNLAYDNSFNDGMDLSFSMSSFVFEKNPNISVSVKANTEFVKEIEFNLTKTSDDVLISLSREILSKNKGWVALTFDITNTAVPNDLGLNSDTRKLGIFLRKMIATPTD
jgi:hypothetical protein